MARPATVLLAFGCLAAACTGRHARPPGSRTAPAQGEPLSALDTAVRGVVAVAGSDPFAQVVVTRTDGAAVHEVAVVGALRNELAALQGAEVLVQGRTVANEQPIPSRAVVASSYEIVTINGEKPVVGELVAREGMLWVTGQQVLDAPPELQQWVGTKVWIVGRITTEGIRVRSYGVITRPPE